MLSRISCNTPLFGVCIYELVRVGSGGGDDDGDRDSISKIGMDKSRNGGER